MIVKGRMRRHQSYLSNSILSNKTIFIVCMIVVIALIADASLARTADLLSNDLARKSGNHIGNFHFISIACIVGQFMILLFVRNRSKEIHPARRAIS